MSTSIKIKCLNEDEGPYEISVNGEQICSTSYNDDGSEGMRKIVNLVRELAEIFGIEVIEQFGNDADA